MTFIAAFAADDVADIVTDTWLHELDLAAIRHTSKVLTLPHADAVVATIGDHEFGQVWDGAAAFLSERHDFDGFNAAAPEYLRRCAGSVERANGAIVVHVGWSPRAERFQVVAFGERDGFTPRRLGGAAFVHPSPLPFRPSAAELANLRDTIDRDPTVYPDDASRTEAHDAFEANYRIMATRPELPLEAVPDTDEAWAAFASRVRRERSTLPVYSRMKVLVGGHLYRTTIGRGAIVQRRIHTFDDSGDEFAKIVALSRHPAALAAPCACESGKRYGDCCVPPG